MNVTEDIRTFEELEQNTKRLIRSVRANRRPMIIMSGGKPDVVIVPVELMTKKKTALRAVCDLAQS